MKITISQMDVGGVKFITPDLVSHIHEQVYLAKAKNLEHLENLHITTLHKMLQRNLEQKMSAGVMLNIKRCK